MNKKNINFELLRIISSFFVIVSHTNVIAFQSLEVQYGFNWFLIMIYQILSKIAVPVFFMISGGLYLKKERTYKEMLSKTFKKLFIPLFVFSVIVFLKRILVFICVNGIIFSNSIFAKNVCITEKK